MPRVDWGTMTFSRSLQLSSHPRETLELAMTWEERRARRKRRRTSRYFTPIESQIESSWRSKSSGKPMLTRLIRRAGLTRPFCQRSPWSLRSLISTWIRSRQSWNLSQQRKSWTTSMDPMTKPSMRSSKHSSSTSSTSWSSTSLQYWW